VDEGDTVRAGDTLAVLDRGEVVAELVSQAAQAARASAQLEDVRAGPRPAEIESARAELKAATAQAEFAAADLERIRKLYEQRVAPNVPVVALGNPERLWMRCYVDAPRLPGVRLGAPAEIRVDGENHVFRGRVTEIATRAEFTPRAALTEDERANLVFGVKVA